MQPAIECQIDTNYGTETVIMSFSFSVGYYAYDCYTTLVFLFGRVTKTIRLRLSTQYTWQLET